MTVRTDVLIVGAGLAGLSTARLLALRLPGLAITLVDKRPADRPTGHKVGESTVEIGARFLDERLGLGDWLRRHALPKNGLRFWFGDRDTSWTDAAEDGPATFGYWPTFQVEREALESELRRRVTRNNADLRHGTTLAARAEHDDDTHRHHVTLDDGTALRARWLIDASGPAAAIARAEGWLVDEPRVPHGACWARFDGARSPDAFCADRRGALCVGPRLLSTNHLMHAGYWIWLIPLPAGRLSVGLVYDPRVLTDPPRDADAFEVFVRGHRMAADVLDGATRVDFGTRRTFARRGRFVDAARRIGCVGEAAGFVDPFYSSGIDFIGLESEALAELLHVERVADIAPHAERYEALIAAFHEQTVQFVADRYGGFGSFARSVPRYRRDLFVYWNLYAWPYFSGQLHDPDFLDRWLPLARQTLDRGTHLLRALDDLPDTLANPVGANAFNQLGYRLVPVLRFERAMGRPVDLDAAAERQWRCDAATLLALIGLRCGDDRLPLRAPLYEAVRAAGLDALLATDWQGKIDGLSAAIDPAVPTTLEGWADVRGWPLERAPLLAEPDWPAPEPLPRPCPSRWSLDQAGWDLPDVDWRSVYEWMADERPTSRAARHYR